MASMDLRPVRRTSAPSIRQKETRNSGSRKEGKRSISSYEAIRAIRHPAIQGVGVPRQVTPRTNSRQITPRELKPLQPGAGRALKPIQTNAAKESSPFQKNGPRRVKRNTRVSSPPPFQGHFVTSQFLKPILTPRHR